jgi:hypothetical protein
MNLKGLMKFKIARRKEQTAEETAAKQVTSLEAQVAERTMDLAAAEQQLRKLASTVSKSGKNGDTTPKPHGPIGELTLDAGEEPVIIDKEEITVVFKDKGKIETEETIKVVEVKAATLPVPAPVPAPVLGKKESEKKKEAEKKDDDFSNLFNNDEEVENPLANLIRSLPEVTPQELSDDLKEIREIIKERQHN